MKKEGVYEIELGMWIEQAELICEIGTDFEETVELSISMKKMMIPKRIIEGNEI